MNHFHEDLDYSHSQSKQPWWEEVYKAAFVDFDGMRSILADGWAQRAGIDRQVMLTGGKVLNIDEKVRRKDWPDIALEYYADVDKRKPGWIAKSLAIDFIAYAFEPSGRCYLLPFQSLRRAWKANRRKWVDLGESGSKGYAIVDAPNRGYVTRSLAIPIPDLLDAVRDAMLVTVAPRFDSMRPHDAGE